MLKERFDFLVQHNLQKPEADVIIIERLVNRLIEHLYQPIIDNHIFCVDPEKLDKYQIDSEPINWGDLQVIEVKKENDEYIVIIDEASPDACPTFCEYIETFMASWGWKVTVKTEW